MVQALPVGSYTVDDVVKGQGWAIQRVGCWVLGHWNEPLTEHRVLECRKLYRAARDAHTRFSVLAVFRGLPFHADLLVGDRARRTTIDVFTETAPAVDALIFPLEGQGFVGSAMRVAAASVVQAAALRLPIHFPPTAEAGLDIARNKGLFHTVAEGTLRERLAALEAIAR